MRRIQLAVLVLGLLSATAAFAAKPNETLLSIQITNGTADLYSSRGPGYIGAYDHSENGLGIQFWKLMSADYAFTASVGIGGFSETDAPGPGAPPGSTDFVYSQSSWNLRVGGDRAVKVGTKAILYFGPGVEFWSGTAKTEGGPGGAPEVESESVGRVSLSGRIGGVMILNDKFGLNFEAGRYIGRASAEDDGAEAHWWPSGFQAAGGLVIRL